MVEATTNTLESSRSNALQSPIISMSHENKRPDNSIQASLIESTGRKIPIPSTFASSVSSVTNDGSSRHKFDRMDDANADSSPAPKKAKLSMLSSGIIINKEEQNSNHEADSAKASLPMRRTTVEERMRARALQEEPPSAGLGSTTGVSTLHTSAGGADHDIVLRIADGIWSQATTLRKQRTFVASTRAGSNQAPKSKEINSNTAKHQTFALKDIIHVLRTTTMSYVGSTGTVMKANGDVKSKLSKRQIVEAILELATPDRYANWIAIIASDSVSPSDQPNIENGIDKDERKGPMLLHDMSPNTMIQVNHSIPYTSVRKEILKTLLK